MLTPAMRASSTSAPPRHHARRPSRRRSSLPPFLNLLPLAEEMTTGLTLARLDGGRLPDQPRAAPPRRGRRRHDGPDEVPASEASAHGASFKVAGSLSLARRPARGFTLARVEYTGHSLDRARDDAAGRVLHVHRDLRRRAGADFLPALALRRPRRRDPPSRATSSFPPSARKASCSCAGRDGRARAFFNVCRHRGTRVCEDRARRISRAGSSARTTRGRTGSTAR